MQFMRFCVLFLAAAWLGGVARAQSEVNGGGSAGLGGVLRQEQSRYCPGCGCRVPPGHPHGARAAAAVFGPYYPGGTDAAQTGFIDDDLSCDIDAATGAHGGRCAGPAGKPGNTVDYAADEFGLSGGQIAGWPKDKFGYASAAHLVQVPASGAGVAIPVVNQAVTGNGAISLTDAELCGVFSGAITNAGQLGLPQAPLSVVYRTDDAGPSLWLTGHLSAVCPANLNGVTFVPTVRLASLFPNGVPANFIGAASQNDAAADLAGCGPAPAGPSAVGYLTPDLTSLAPNSATPITCVGGSQELSPLVVANLVSKGKPVLPTLDGITLGLNSAAAGKHLRPPSTQSAALQPANWAPLVTQVSEGYPIVGYTLFTFAQCYENAAAASAITSFLDGHYQDPGYGAIQNANLFVQLNALKNGYFAAGESDFICNASNFNLQIGESSVCAGFAGR